MAWFVTGTMVAVSAYSAYSSASSANESAEMQQANAERKYRLESGTAVNQMEEQQSIAMQEMTEVSRAFLKAKSTAEAQQAESGVAGVSAQRAKSVMNTKEGEAKGKVAQEIDTNVINIAQGMLASKIETEGIIQEAESKKRNVMFDTVLGGIQGALSGYSMGKSAGGTTPPAKTETGYLENSLDPSTGWLKQG